MKVKCFGDGQDAGVMVRAGPGSVRPPVSPIPSLSTFALSQGHRAGPATQTNGFAQEASMLQHDMKAGSVIGVRPSPSIDR